jgi:dTDP-4-amino-4,6-dideoxygalactose transaminase
MTGSRIAFFGLQRQYAALREELLSVTDQVLGTGRVMDGYHPRDFESWLARYNDRQHAILCHSGTQALEIIARFFAQQSAVYSRHQPSVVVPALTYPATANAWITAGWNVILADVDANGLLDNTPDSSGWDAVCLVGLYGASVMSLGDDWSHRIVVEDAAQHWLSLNGNRRGSAAAISFDPTKNLGNYANGGAVITNDPDIAEFARNWISNGRTSDHRLVGSNSRMSEVDCAQMMVKTRYLAAWQERRRQIAEYWTGRFQDCAVRCLINADTDSLSGHCIHKFVIASPARDSLQHHLWEQGIETRIHYERALHELPAFERYRNPGMINKASSLSRQVLSLPMYPELIDSEVEFIADQVLAHDA